MQNLQQTLSEVARLALALEEKNFKLQVGVEVLPEGVRLVVTTYGRERNSVVSWDKVDTLRDTLLNMVTNLNEWGDGGLTGYIPDYTPD